MVVVALKFLSVTCNLSLVFEVIIIQRCFDTAKQNILSRSDILKVNFSPSQAVTVNIPVNASWLRSGDWVCLCGRASIELLEAYDPPHLRYSAAV